MLSYIIHFLIYNFSHYCCSYINNYFSIALIACVSLLPVSLRRQLYPVYERTSVHAQDIALINGALLNTALLANVCMNQWCTAITHLTSLSHRLCNHLALDNVDTQSSWFVMLVRYHGALFRFAIMFCIVQTVVRTYPLVYICAHGVYMEHQRTPEPSP